MDLRKFWHASSVRHSNDMRQAITAGWGQSAGGTCPVGPEWPAFRR
jgi:hypothetical protein